MKTNSKVDILVTGGAGYIGSHVVKQLIKYTDYNITIIDNLSTGHSATIEQLRDIIGKKEQKLKFIEEDLSNFEAINRIFEENSFDGVIHFAASIVVPESVENPLKYYMNNTVNTTNLINLCNQYNIKKVIFSSTAAVYGEPKVSDINEDIDLSPINPYGWSKRMSEQVIIDTAKSNENLKYVIFRYFNVAGADIQNRIGQSFPNATHLIKVASQTALGQREKMAIYGDSYDTPDGTCIRDYIHIDDLAFAHIMALEYLDKRDSDIFNVGYGKGYSVKEVIDTMKRVSQVDFKVELEDKRAGDPAILISNNSKITKAWSDLDGSNLKSQREKLFEYDDLDLICKTALNWEKKLNKQNSIYDVIVIGGGPGGIASAIEAKAMGIDRVLLIEKNENHSHTIRTFYKDKKRVDKDWRGQIIDIEGNIPFIDGTKESTIEYFDEILNQEMVDRKFSCEVEKVEKQGGIFKVHTTCGLYRAKFVVVSIGRMGKPNKPSYKIPPKIRARVNYNLDKCTDSEDILVVGGGDSAVEYACDLAERNRVVLNYRRDTLSRPNPMNQSMVKNYIESTLLTLKLGIDIVALDEVENRVEVTFADNSQEVYDRVIYAIGGTTPTDFLKKCSITLNSRGNPIFNEESCSTEIDGLYIAGDILFDSGGSIATALNHGYRIVSDILKK